MLQRITTKLKHFASLGAADVSALESVLDDRKSHDARTDVVREGTLTGYSLVVVSGWACRYKVLKNGSRQITAFLLAGDSAHLNAVTRAPVDYNIGAISAVEVARIPWPKVMHLATHYPVLRSALMASQVADETLLRAAIVSIGRRDAEERIGYQLCELWCRAAAVGLVHADRMNFPVTQADLADCVGLTAVHVNRMLQRLRNHGLVDWQGHHLSIPNFHDLARLSGFERTPRYGDCGSTPPIQRLYQPNPRDGAGEARAN